MKRLLIAAPVLIAGVWLGVGQNTTSAPLASFFPPGALLYLEARDLAALLRDWNASAEKAAWLKSANYQAFSRTHLLLRLQQARDEFAAAAGIPADMALVESAAGTQSGLALYSIGNLEFLYLTRLPAARALQTALWSRHTAFQTRTAAGSTFYVRTDAASQRTAAFASLNDWLVLATREDLLAGALTLLARQPAPHLAAEEWFRAALGAAATPGDLRLVLKMDTLARGPHFRSHWIHANAGAWRSFRAAVCDLRRAAGEWREDRVFLRAEPAAARGGGALSQLARLVPDDAGAFRVWTDPDPDHVLGALAELLHPAARGIEAGTLAPALGDVSGAGSEADLETRIDEPPRPAPTAALRLEPLRPWLRQQGAEALLVLGATRPVPGGVFVDVARAVAVQAPTAWNAESARAAVSAALEALLTVSGLGNRWTSRGNGYVLDGPLPLFLATQGRVLIVANAQALIDAMLPRLDAAPTVPPGSYAAGYRHARERAHFARLSRLLDFSAVAGTAPAEQQPEEPREPEFFSENLASLGAVLARLQSAQIVVREEPTQVVESVSYRIAP